MKSQPEIIKTSGSELRPVGGGASVLSIMSGKKMNISYFVVPTGKSPHPWHTHTVDEDEYRKMTYAEGFEQVYFILQGSGIVEWEENGKIESKKVERDDFLLFPPDIPKHQLVNTGNESMVVVAIGAPPIQFEYKKK